MKIGVFGNNYQMDKLGLITKVFNQLHRFSFEVYVENIFYNYLLAEYNYHPDITGLIQDTEDYNLDMALSLGGDGTFLRTAAIIGRKNIPILGINIGRLGFLADINQEEIEETLSEVFENHYQIEERSLLQLDIDRKYLETENFALNEIAILKRDTSSMITIQAFINDEYLNTYLADGLLIATPTGSTAYSMSVNGPIITPHAKNFVLSPVAPHSLNVRPLIIPEESHIRLQVETHSHNFLIALDGRSVVLPSNAEFSVRKADFSINVVKRHNQTFYQTLRKKLLWGNDVRKL